MSERNENDKRIDSSGPPTIIMRTYNEMDEDDKNRLEKLGVGMIVFAGGIPIIAGIFIDLSLAYWLFSASIASLGVCFLFPALGVWFIDVALKVIAMVVPAMKEKVRPDRRQGRDE